MAIIALILASPTFGIGIKRSLQKRGCGDLPPCGIFKYENHADIDVTHCVFGSNLYACIREGNHPCACDNCTDKGNDNFHCGGCGCMEWC